MGVFVTSDLHFSHANLWKKWGRPFSSNEEMNSCLVNNWNAAVGKEDNIFVLGDFFMGRVDSIPKILPELNGHIYLVVGNHDLQNPKRIDEYRLLGVNVIMQEKVRLSYNDVTVWMVHDPAVLPEDKEDNELYLYGHLHNHAPKGLCGNMFHVGVDTNDFTPINLDAIVGEFNEKLV